MGTDSIKATATLSHGFGQASDRACDLPILMETIVAFPEYHTGSSEESSVRLAAQKLSQEVDSASQIFGVSPHPSGGGGKERRGWGGGGGAGDGEGGRNGSGRLLPSCSAVGIFLTAFGIGHADAATEPTAGGRMRLRAGLRLSDLPDGGRSREDRDCKLQPCPRPLRPPPPPSPLPPVPLCFTFSIALSTVPLSSRKASLPVFPQSCDA